MSEPTAGIGPATGPSPPRSIPGLAKVREWVARKYKEGRRLQIFFARREKFELASFQAGRTITLDNIRIILNGVFGEEPESNTGGLRGDP